MQKPFFIYLSIASAILALSLYLLSCNGRGKRISYPGTTITKVEKDSISKFRFALDGKFRGMHVRSENNINKQALLPLVRANIEWVVHTPYIIQDDYNSTDLQVYDYHMHQSINKMSYERDLLESARNCNIKCIVKPLLWLDKPGEGEWRGSIRFDSEADWQLWADKYRSIILAQAKTCEAMGVEAFCVGTELTSVVEQHPDYLRKLIRDVRQVYSGIVLYAANWDREYEMVPFWDEVDYIGISAYFPLSNKKYPSIRKLKKGWRKYIPQIEQVSQRFNKPVVFTEIGYRSTSNAATRPWEWVKDAHALGEHPSPKTQASCYEALFQTCWNKEWFAGALLWDWKVSAHTTEDRIDISFSPQQKPAEAILSKWFAK